MFDDTEFQAKRQGMARASTIAAPEEKKKGDALMGAVKGNIAGSTEGAGTGAALGSIGGPVGTIIGAIVGGAAGGTMGAIQGYNEAEEGKDTKVDSAKTANVISKLAKMRAGQESGESPSMTGGANASAGG